MESEELKVSLELEDMNGGLENQNKFTISIPAVLIRCMAQLLCHILDLDLI